MYMKKLVCVLMALVLGVGVSLTAKSRTCQECWICYDSGFDRAYTVRGNDVCYGSGYDVAYTIRGDEVCYETGYNVVYTIR